MYGCKRNEAEEMLRIGKYKPCPRILITGHVNSGKSTILGHLLCILDAASYKTPQSKNYSWIVDRLEEEQNMGNTIDLAYHPIGYKDSKLILIDSPGHADFLYSLVSGLLQTSAVIYVVDACEHHLKADTAIKKYTGILPLIKCLGDVRMLVAVNKMDKVGWNMDVFCSIVSTLSQKMAEWGLEITSYIPVSGLGGENLVVPYPDDGARTLMDAVIDMIKNNRPVPNVRGPSLGVVERIIKRGGCSAVIEAFMVDGVLWQKMAGVLHPVGTKVEISKMQSAHGDAEFAYAGDTVTMTICGKGLDTLYESMLISSIDCVIRSGEEIRTTIAVVDDIEDTPFVAGLHFTFIYGKIQEECVIVEQSQMLASKGDTLSARIRLLSKVTYAPACAGRNFFLLYLNRAIAFGIITE